LSINATSSGGGQVIQWLEYCPENRFKVVTFETAARNGEPFEALIAKRKFLPNRVARFCTQELKIRVIKHYMQSLGHKEWVNVVGIRYDEPKRWRGKGGPVPGQVWENWHPLVEMRISKPDVLKFWRSMPFDLELKEHQGNCDFCFLKGVKKKKQIIRESPEKVAWWSDMEKRTRSTWHADYSVDQLAHAVSIAPTLFDNIELDLTDIECHCNVD
jgi:hypothetical protein